MDPVKDLVCSSIFISAFLKYPKMQTTFVTFPPFFSSYPVVIRLHKGRCYRLQIGQNSSSQWMGLSVYSACSSNKKHFNRCDVLCVPSKHCPLCKKRHPRAFIRRCQLLPSRLLLFFKDVSATLQKGVASEPRRKITLRDCLGGIRKLRWSNSYWALLCKCVLKP